VSDPITPALDGILRECAADAGAGALADYIPELLRADPELRGDVDFAAAELVLRMSRERGRAPLVLDLSGVTRLHPVAQRLLDAIPTRA
jgi:hypothetical protein